MSKNQVQKIILGTRGSELALWQANYVKKELGKKNRGIEIQIKIIKTSGDKIQDVALSKIGDKSLFTKELEMALINKQIDLAVHSLKDLQTEIPEELQLGAITKRHNVEDVLIARKKGIAIDDLKDGAVVATGSLRRKCQLLHLRPDINVIDLRGNVATRINKFLNSDWDAIILARAGVERLRLGKYISSFIKPDLLLPAVGQGALGVEIHKENKFVKELLLSINDSDTYTSVLAERSLLKTLEGGCQVPIGATAEVKANGLYLDAMVGSLDGSITFRKKARGSKISPDKLGKSLAKDLLRAGAKSILEDIYKTSRSK